MNNFILKIYNKEVASPSIVDVTISGGAYSISIDEIYRGTMVRDSSSPLGYSTTDHALAPYLEPIAHALKNKKNWLSISEMLTAVLGIMQLIAFLSGTIVTFKFKEVLQKAKIFLALNLLPLLIECIDFEHGILFNLLNGSLIKA